jgi:hypothetical protein
MTSPEGDLDRHSGPHDLIAMGALGLKILPLAAACDAYGWDSLEMVGTRGDGPLIIEPASALTCTSTRPRPCLPVRATLGSTPLRRRACLPPIPVGQAAIGIHRDRKSWGRSV